jgi:fibronectin-binding autotransporter adhesin
MNISSQHPRRATRRFIVLRLPLPSLVAALLLTSLLAAHVRAADLQWGSGGAGGTGTWNTTSSNWYNGTVNTNWNSVTPDSAIFGGAAGTVTLGEPITVRNLTFNTGGYTIAGGTLTLSAPTAAVISNAANVATISSVLAGTAGLTKSGTGTLTLSGSNSFSGNFSLGGTVRVGHDSALGKGAVTLSAFGTLASDGATTRTITNALTIGNFTIGDATGTGDLIFTGSADLFAAGRNITVNNSSTFSGAVTNAIGGLIKAGAGTLTLSGANTYAAGTTLTTGTLRVGSDSALGTGGFTINGGTFASSSASARTLTNAVTMGGNVQLGDATGTGALTFSNINLGAATRTLTVSNATTVAGAISGAVGLTKAGTGTLTLSASNAFSGAFTLSAGTVRVGHDSALGTGAATLGLSVVLSSDGSATRTISNAVTMGSLVFYGDATGTGDLIFTGNHTTMGTQRQMGVNNATTISGAVSGTGGLDKQGAGTLTLSGNNTYALGTTVRAGTLRVGSDSALGTGGFTINGGIFTSDGATPRTITNAITMGGNVQLGDASALGSLTFSNINLGAATRTMTVGASTTVLGVLSDGGLTKDGLGQLTLAGVNTYDGVTTVTNGILIAANNAALGSTVGGTVVASGASLRLGTSTGGAVTIGNEALTISGFGGAAATDGALRAASGTNTWGGKVTLAADATVRAAANLGLIFDVDSGDAIDLQNHTLTMNSSGSGLIEMRDGISGTGGITKIGSGTATFSGTNSYSGATTISNGVLRAGAAAGGQVFGNLSAVTLASAPDSQTALDLNNFSQTIGSLSGGGVGGNNLGVLLGSGTLTTGGNNTSTTYNGQISGAGGLVKTGTGTQTLTASNTYTGATTVQAGSLIINGSSASGSVLNVASGATLGGSGTIGGATTISGIHRPGNSAGVQTFASDLTYSGTPTVQWELTANTTTQGSPTPVFDQIVVNGNLDFAVPTALTLNFALPGSAVDWSDGLWASNITGTSGWLVYDVGGTLSNLTNFSISVENWADGQGDLFNTVRAGSSFSLYNDNVSGDIYLNYAVPEPSTYALIMLAGAGLMAHRWRSRRRSGGGSFGQ